MLKASYNLENVNLHQNVTRSYNVITQSYIIRILFHMSVILIIYSCAASICNSLFIE